MPFFADTMAPSSWILDRPEEKVTLDELASLGVFYQKLDHTKYENQENAELEQLCKERGYTYRDFVDSAKIPNLEEKLDHFKTEHLHDDDEIRFFLGGSGYFDVKNRNDEYVRIHCFPGDLIVLPRGIYHRFMPDASMSFYVMRLFCGDPVWTPHNRSEAATQSRIARKEYLREFYPEKATPAVYLLDDPERKEVSLEKLAQLGVFYRKMNPQIYEDDPALEALCTEKGYNYRDFVDSQKIPNLGMDTPSARFQNLGDVAQNASHVLAPSLA